MLATSPGDKKIYEEFIASKAETPEKAKAELDGLTVEEAIEHASTVFFRGPNGEIRTSSHLVKGNIKENIRNLIDLGDCPLSQWQVKRVVNSFVQMPDEFITYNVAGEVTTLQRPLRAETLRGDRVALARSEQIGSASTCEFSIIVLEPENLPLAKKDKGSDHLPLSAYVQQALRYGEFNGLGCWRSAGFGRYSVEI